MRLDWANGTERPSKTRMPNDIVTPRGQKLNRQKRSGTGSSSKFEELYGAHSQGYSHLLSAFRSSGNFSTGRKLIIPHYIQSTIQVNGSSGTLTDRNFTHKSKHHDLLDHKRYSLDSGIKPLSTCSLIFPTTKITQTHLTIPPLGHHASITADLDGSRSTNPETVRPRDHGGAVVSTTATGTANKHASHVWLPKVAISMDRSERKTRDSSMSSSWSTLNGASCRRLENGHHNAPPPPPPLGNGTSGSVGGLWYRERTNPQRHAHDKSYINPVREKSVQPSSSYMSDVGRMDDSVHKIDMRHAYHSSSTLSMPLLRTDRDSRSKESHIVRMQSIPSPLGSVAEKEGLIKDAIPDKPVALQALQEKAPAASDTKGKKAQPLANGETKCTAGIIEPKAEHSPAKTLNDVQAQGHQQTVPLPAVVIKNGHEEHETTVKDGKPVADAPIAAAVVDKDAFVHPKAALMKANSAIMGKPTRKSSLSTLTGSKLSAAKHVPKIRTPLSPKMALTQFGNDLSNYEQSEIVRYAKVWYLGIGSEKIQGNPGTTCNDGFDDENGGYLKVSHDHLAYRFEVLETLGKGSFGRVVRAIDHQSGNQVAVKIIRNKKRFHQQAQVEVTVLQDLKTSDPNSQCNVVHIIEYFTFRNHLCIVFDLLGSNLYDILRKNDYRGFTLHSLRKVAVKLLESLALLRRLGIIHCDLKPENILTGLRNPSELRVIDFGSSCYQNRRIYTYIQSRFYRAPEIILGLSYGPPIDIWSFGCILSELYTGRPLFPGENESEQLACIMEVLGHPPENVMDKATRRRVFFDTKGSPRTLTNSRGRKRVPGSQTLEGLVKTMDSKFLDLISKCLTWNADERITAEAALNHDWIKRGATRQKRTEPRQQGSHQSLSSDARELSRQTTQLL